MAELQVELSQEVAFSSSGDIAPNSPSSPTSGSDTFRTSTRTVAERDNPAHERDVQSLQNNASTLASASTSAVHSVVMQGAINSSTTTTCQALSLVGSSSSSIQAEQERNNASTLASASTSALSLVGSSSLIQAEQEQSVLSKDSQGNDPSSGPDFVPGPPTFAAERYLEPKYLRIMPALRNWDVLRDVERILGGEANMVNVTFYVLLAESSTMETGAPLCIEFRNQRKFSLAIARIPTGHLGYTVTCSLPWDFGPKSNPPEYRYLVEYNASLSDAGSLYESPLLGSIGNEVIFRQLLIPQRIAREGVWRQYDMVIMPEVRLDDTASMKLIELMPNLEDCLTNGHTAQEIVDCFYDVKQCIRANGLFLYGATVDNLDELPKKVAESRLADDAERHIRTLTSEQSDQQRPSLRRILAGLLLVGLMRKHSTPNIIEQYAARILASLNIAAFTEEEVHKALDTVHFKQSEIGSALSDFMSIVAKKGHPQWLLAVPLSHLLNLNPPNGVMVNQMNYTQPEWWGVDRSLWRALETFKACELEFDVKMWYELMQSSLKRSRLTTRTFIAALSSAKLRVALAELLSLPLDACLAAVMLQFFSDQQQGSSSEVQPSALVLLQAITAYVKALSNGEYPRGLNVASEFVRSLRLLDSSLTGDKGNNYAGWEFVVHMCDLATVLCTLSSRFDAKAPVSQLEAEATSFIEHAVQWISKALSFEMADEHAMGFRKDTEVQMWTSLLQVSWKESTLQDVWKSKLKEIIVGRISKMPVHAKVSLYYLSDFKYEFLESLFEAAAIEASYDAMESRHFEFKKECGHAGLKKFGKILCSALAVTWNKCVNKEPVHKIVTIDLNVLKLILSWPQFLLCSSIARGDHHSVLDEPSKEKLHYCAGIVIECYRQLQQSGELHYEKLTFLLDNAESFVRIVLGLNADKAFPNGVATCLELRKCEKQEFEQLRSDLQVYETMCLMLGNVKPEPSLVTKLREDISMREVRELWVYTSPGESVEPLKCRWFSTVKLAKVEMLRRMSDVHTSLVFRHFWRDVGEKYAQNKVQRGIGPMPSVTIDEVHKNIWVDAYNRYTDFGASLKNHTATFGQISLLKKEYTVLDWRAEVDRLVKEPEHSEDVYQRIKLYLKFESYRKGAAVILELKRSLSLSGDFGDLDVITNSANDATLRLSDIKDTLLKVGEQMIALRETKNVDCLDVFNQNLEFVKWVKDTVKETELNVFVDFCTIAAGEQDSYLEMGSLFLDSVTGYTPLIYELSNTFGLTEFLEKCQQLWKTLQSNERLPKQLNQCGRNCDWFEKVKKSLGAVEVTSLAQATALNEHGKYEVGFLQKDSVRRLHPDHELDEIVHVMLPETDIGEQLHGRGYTYSQLTELHSKLMLVHHKVDQNKNVVDRFVKMFDSITNLAYAYLKACRLGTLLFDSWRSELYTSNEHRGKACVFFSNSTHVTQKDHRVPLKDRPGEEHAHTWATFFERCSEQWQNVMNQRRRISPQLNAFTTQEIVFLRRTLPTLRDAKDNSVLSAKAYALLAMLVPFGQKKIKNFMETKASDRGLFTKDETMKFPDASKLEPEIAELWTILDASGFQDDLDYVSLESLERILEQLQANFAIDTVRHARTPPSGIHHARPNLIVCPEDKVLATTLSLYVPHCENDANSPCPTRNEVLVCSDQTTLEEVDLLLERAFTNASTLYCLTHAHRLSYDVCGHIERRLDKKEEDEHYKNGYYLVVICAEEYKDQSRIATALERFKTGSFEITESVRAYVRRMLGGNPQIAPMDMARDGGDSTNCEGNAMERSFSRLVLSRRAGLGKTLYVKDLAEKCAKDIAEKRPVQSCLLCTIQLVEESVDVRAVIEKLYNAYAQTVETEQMRIVHINVAQEVVYGVNELLFNLLILGSIRGQDDCVWQQSQNDYYLIEAVVSKSDAKNVEHLQSLHSFLDLLPFIECISPLECLDFLLKQENTRHYDEDYGTCATARIYLKKYKTLPWQRTFNHLCSHKQRKERKAGTVENGDRHLPRSDDPKLVLKILLKYCGVDNPSWFELRNFVHFFDVQLTDCENSFFCSSAVAKANLPGFTEFVVDFMLLMSKDFATGSLDISEESLHAVLLKGESEQRQSDFLNAMEMKRKWEAVPHPYIFFNQDRETLTFLGFRVHWFDRHFMSPDGLGDLELGGDRGKDQVLGLDPIDKDLFNSLKRNGVDLAEDFSQMKREDRIKKLYAVMGSHDNFFQDIMDACSNNGVNLPLDSISLDSKGKAMDMLARTKGCDPNERFFRDVAEVLAGHSISLPSDFPQKPSDEKIEMIRMAIGKYDRLARDPDRTYELTLDNVNKILAIHMRFRCRIPVIIMGETGCGKTRLVKFMCELQVPKGRRQINNFILVKVHGGTTAEQLRKRIHQAHDRARKNQEICPDIHTVLFLDEANTTSAIGLIKEVMCDGTLDGAPLEDFGLRIIAAVNPYRKHSQGMIERLESAGLGYHVEAKSTTDRLGTIPMRQLVYRVRALPQSLLHLVWDFGQLSPATEEDYIAQMIPSYLKDLKERDCQPKNPEEQSSKDDIASRNKAIARVLVECQKFMRLPKGRCNCRFRQGASQQRHFGDSKCPNWQTEQSFVSLRDIERVLKVMSWFFSNYDLLYPSSDIESDHLDRATWSLLLAVGVCYQACLQPEWRAEFRRTVSRQFVGPMRLHNGVSQMQTVVEQCQSAVVKAFEGHIPDNIAHNQALTENIFIMVICVDLRIPLFLVGKPGSSKSLAKTIVAKAMQDQRSTHALFQRLKEVHVVSFQCSPLATPEGIVSTFKQAAAFQKSRDISKFASVVVLDEIGLAEDSKLMPLKSLHHLLEEGCDGDEAPEPFMKCAFIGISNWSLDPAKMNRGIMVQRSVPEAKELEDTARSICQSAYRVLDRYIASLSNAYLKLLKDDHLKREFFGLRDFYSLIKMLAFFADSSKSASNDHPTAYQFRHAILRNFGGSNTAVVMKIFEEALPQAVKIESSLHHCDDDPPCDAIGVIDCSLSGKFTGTGGESRYLLLLTESGSVFNLVKQKLHSLKPERLPEVIFGSEFRKDLHYSQVCRNINRIRMLMETGKTVLLLNLENLYESLYDALNQYYVPWDNARYTELGLGTHRVKCRVREEFRLIVIADKNVVHNHYPIPLINRLEKHYVTARDLLTTYEQEIADKLTEWAKKFADNCNTPTSADHSMTTNSPSKSLPQSVFVGYSDDDAAPLVWQACKDSSTDLDKNTILEKAKVQLLLCATPDAVLRSSKLGDEYGWIFKSYFTDHPHDSLGALLAEEISKARQDMFLQVTTYYNLLSHSDFKVLKSNLSSSISVQDEHFVCSLEAIETETSFAAMVSSFYESRRSPHAVLIIQCPEGNRNAKLLACAKHVISREYDAILALRKSQDCVLHYHVVLLVQLQPSKDFRGFLGGLWKCVHIDDLHPRKKGIPLVTEAFGKSLSELLKTGMSAEGITVSHSGANRSDTYSSFKTVELLPHFWHEAASYLRDKNAADSQRKAVPLDVLYRLFSADGGDEVFQKRFTEYLVQIISLREDQHKSSDGGLWLLNVTSIGGSFRRGLEDYLEKKIAPIFAEAIAFLNVNGNLDLLLPGTQASQQQPKFNFFEILAQHPEYPKDKLNTLSVESWRKPLWLQIFKGFDKSPDFTPSFKEIVVQSCHNLRYEVPVLHKSGSNKPFPGQFPFSWLLKELLDPMVVQAIKRGVRADVNVNRKLREGKVFGEAVGSLTSSNEKSAINYLHDLVHLEYALAPEVYQIVFVSILQHAHAKQLLSVTGVHICYVELIPRLTNLLCLLDGNASVKKHVYSYVENGGQERAIMDSMDTDSLALMLLLQQSMPHSPQTHILEWYNSVLKYQSVIEEMVSAREETYLEGTSARAYFNASREIWSRLLPIKIISDHFLVPPPRMDSEITTVLSKIASKGIVILNASLGISNGEHLVTVKAFESFLRYCLIHMRQHFCRKDNIPLAFHCKKPIEFCYDQEKWYQYFKDQSSACFMRLLNDLVFAGHELPEEGLVKHVVSLVFVRDATKQSYPIVDTSLINPTPVLQSFVLLHLLRLSSLRHDEIAVHCISASFDQTGDDPETVAYKKEFCTFVISRYQDYIWESDILKISRSQYHPTQSEIINSVTTELLFAMGNISKSFANTMHTAESLAPTLRYAARFRLYLVIGADFIADQVLNEQQNSSQPVDIQDFISALRKYCNYTREYGDWPRKFLIKWLIDKHGISRWHRAFHYGNAFRFIAPAELEGKDWLSDPFVIGKDEDYKTLRAALLQSAEDGSITRALLRASKREVFVNHFYALLAIFSLGIRARYRNDPSAPCSKEALQVVCDSMGQSWKMAEKLYNCLVGTSLPKKPRMIIDSTTDLGDAQLALAIYHLCAALFALEGHQRRITSPLSDLLVRPTNVKDVKMPYEHLARRQNSLVNPSKFSISAGALQPAAQAVLDSLLSMTLYASGVINGSPQHMDDIISHKDVSEWLWNAIASNIKMLQALLSKSHDDCVMFLHAVISRLINLQQEECYSWSTDGSYRNWENEMFIQLLQPAFKDYDKIYADISKSLLDDASDTSVTKDVAQLLKDGKEPLDFDKLLQHPAVWQHRDGPSVDHFVARLHIHCCSAESHIFWALRAFILDRKRFSAIKFLPDIIRLITTLSQEASLRLRASDVSGYNVSNFPLTIGSSGCSAQADKFITAWNCVRQELAGYSFKWSGETLEVPSEACENDMSKLSDIGMLLPGTRGHGRCAVGLVTYLAQLHNDFLEKVLAKKPEHSVPLIKASQTHLIDMSFDPDVDLLPIILCNYNYSPQEETTQITYNFDNVQKQIVDRFVRHKARLSDLDSGALDAVKPVSYREGLTTGYLLKTLSDVVKQNPLTSKLKVTVRRETRASSNTLHTAIDVMEKALGFLISMEPSPSEKLTDYLQGTLHIELSGTVKSIFDGCCVSHAKALWLLLSFERAKQLNNQECFKDVSHCFRNPLQDSSAQKLKESLKRSTKGGKKKILEILHEFIWLQLSEEEEVSLRKYHGLFDVLLDYAKTSPDTLIRLLEQLSQECRELQLQHAVHAWRLISSSISGHH